MKAYVLPLVLVAVASACSPPPPAAAPSTEPSASSSPGPTGTDADKEAAAAQDGPKETPGQPAPDKLDEKKSEEKKGGGKVGAAAVDEKPLGGKLTQDDIKQIVEKNGALFDECYSIGAGKGQQFTGKVTLKVTLGPTGSVNEAVVASSTTKNAKVDRCVADGFKKIKFPTPKDGATSVFTFPMEFKGAVETH